MITLSEWLAPYSTNTRKAYLLACDDLCQFTGVFPDRVTEEKAQAWAEDMARRGVSNNTIRLRISAMSSFCKAHGLRDFTANIIRPDRTPAARNADHRPLTEEEARALVSAIDTTDLHGLQDYALILGYLMVPQKDARKLRWGDFNMARAQVFIGSLLCPPELFDAVRSYLKAAGRLETIENDEPIFTALSERWLRLPNNQAHIEELKDHPWDRRPLSIQEVAKRIRKYARLAGIDHDVTARDLRATAHLVLDWCGFTKPTKNAVSHTRPLRRALLTAVVAVE